MTELEAGPQWGPFSPAELLHVWTYTSDLGEMLMKITEHLKAVLCSRLSSWKDIIEGQSSRFLSSLSIAVVRAMTKATWLGKELFFPACLYDCPSLMESMAGTQEIQESKNRTWSLFLWIISHGLLSQPSLIVQDHPPRDDANHSGLYPLTLNINLENFPQTYLSTNTMEAIP